MFHSYHLLRHLENDLGVYLLFPQSSLSSASKFHTNSFSHQLSSIKIITSIISIAIVIKLYEGKSIFQRYFSKFSIFPKEIFNITFTSFIANTSNVNSSRHYQLLLENVSLDIGIISFRISELFLIISNIYILLLI